MNTDPDSTEPDDDHHELRAIAAFIGWSILYVLLRAVALLILIAMIAALAFRALQLAGVL